jgi:hypothetical protein
MGREGEHVHRKIRGRGIGHVSQEANPGLGLELLADLGWQRVGGFHGANKQELQIGEFAKQSTVRCGKLGELFEKMADFMHRPIRGGGVIDREGLPDFLIEPHHLRGSSGKVFGGMSMVIRMIVDMIVGMLMVVVGMASLRVPAGCAGGPAASGGDKNQRHEDVGVRRVNATNVFIHPACGPPNPLRDLHAIVLLLSRVMGQATR